MTAPRRGHRGRARVGRPSLPMLILIWLLLSSATALGDRAGPPLPDGTGAPPMPSPSTEGPGGGGGRFIENAGQWSDDVRFVATGASVAAAMGVRGVTYDVPTGPCSGARVRASFAGAAGAEPVGSGDLGYPTSYLLGDDSSLWAVGARSFAEVIYRDAWPCVDVRYRFSGGALKYDVVLRPGADASDVSFLMEGQESLVVGRDAVVARLGGGHSLQDLQLTAWYGDGDREAVPVRFEGRPGGFGFTVEAEPGREVVIDPVVTHASTFLGSQYDDDAMDVEVDADGDVYVLSQAASADFPTTPGSYSRTNNGYDLAVTKLNHNLSQVVWSTFIGGSAWDQPAGFDLDEHGQLYITGQTVSNDFPVTDGCMQPQMNGGKNKVQPDGFLCKLAEGGGALVYSTFIGGSGPETPNDVRVRDGRAAVVGWTDSKDFPTDSGFFASVHGDAFLILVSEDGSETVAANFWGGYEWESAIALAFDKRGDIVVVGGTSSRDFWVTPGVFQTTNPCFQSGFVSRYSPDNDTVLWSTYLGGAWEMMDGVAVDDEDYVYITGFTYWSGANSYPTTPGAFDRTYNGRTDGLVTKMDPDGTRLVYSTLVGGDGDDRVQAFELDRDGNAVVVGYATSGGNFTVTEGCPDPVMSGPSEGFIFVLDANGTAPVFSTFVGGSADDALSGVAIDGRDNLVVVGKTNSVDLAVTEGAFQGRISGGFDVLVAIVGEAAPASAPRDLAANGLEGLIELTWSAPLSDGGYPVRSYVVQRGLSEGTLSHYAALGTSTQFLDNNVSWGVTYHYAVVADNGKGRSPRSNVASAMSVTVPSAPLDLTANVTLDGVGLAWEAPSFTGGLPVVGYRVYRGAGGEAPALVAVTGPGGLAYEDRGVADGTAYTYELACANSYGESRSRARVSVRTHDVPTPPLALRHTYGDLFIDLAWDAPARDNGLPVVGYRVYRAAGAGPAQLVGEVAVATRTFRDVSVEVGVAYSYHATAINAKGESAPSETLEATARVRPGPPTGLTATAEAWAVRLEWSAPALDGASPVLGYWAYHETGPGAWVCVGGVYVEGRPGAALAFLHDAPYDGSERRYRVTAFNAEGESDPSEVARTAAYEAPSPPLAPALAWGDGELTLTWDPPASDGGTPVTAYTVHRRAAGDAGLAPVITLPAAVRRFVDDAVTNGIGYTYRVTARNLVGDGAASVDVSSVPAGRPGRPEGVSGKGLDCSVRLTWAPPASSGGRAITGYRVYGMTDALHLTLLAETGPDSTAHAVDGLENARSYLFAVSAVTPAGEGPMSDAVEVMPVGPPSEPVGLAAVFADGVVHVTWSAPARTGGAAITGYMIRRADREAGNWTGLDGSATAFADRDVEPGRTYAYSLYALNAAGAGQAVTVNITVPMPVEGPPRAGGAPAWPFMAIGLAMAVAVAAAYAARRRRGQ